MLRRAWGSPEPRVNAAFAPAHCGDPTYSYHTYSPRPYLNFSLFFFFPNRGFLPLQRAMAGTTTDPYTAPSPLLPMHHPTMTQHDYRFPRRPDDAGPRKSDLHGAYTPARSTLTSTSMAAPPRISTATAAAATSAAAPATMMGAAAPGASRSGASGASGASRSGAGLHDARLDQPLTHGGVHQNLLRTAAFQPFQQSAAREAQNLDDMQRQDPLATQVWKFYARTKQFLPAQERMENLTWRMMHVKLQSARALSALKYVSFPRPWGGDFLLFLFLFLCGLLCRSFVRSFLVLWEKS